MQPTTFWDEAVAAARGSWALLRGDRSAPFAFDFSPRGLAGSFIALVLILSTNAVLGSLGAENGPGLAAVISITAVIYGFEIGFAALTLNFMQRLDGLVPHIVADNWSRSLIGVIVSVAILAGVNNILVLMVGLAALIIKINIARLIVTLTPWQVAGFVVAQLAGSFVGVMVTALFLPLPAGMVLPV